MRMGRAHCGYAVVPIIGSSRIEIVPVMFRFRRGRSLLQCTQLKLPRLLYIQTERDPYKRRPDRMLAPGFAVPPIRTTL